MARNSNKDIDFLSVYKTKKKINIDSKTLLLIALPVLLILIFATSTLYLTITNRNLQKDVDTLQTQIEEALAVTASNTNSDQQKELSELNEQLTNLQTITQTLSKYPQIDKNILETITPLDNLTSSNITKSLKNLNKYLGLTSLITYNDLIDTYLDDKKEHEPVLDDFLVALGFSRINGSSGGKSKLFNILFVYLIPLI